MDDSAPTPDEPPASTTPQAEQAIAPQPQPPHTPQVVLTFLLVSGRRRTMNFDPTHNVGRVKELLWNAWPGGTFSLSYQSVSLVLFVAVDWQDDRPPAPSFLRILYRGRILQDDDILKSPSSVRFILLVNLTFTRHSVPNRRSSYHRSHVYTPWCLGRRSVKEGGRERYLLLRDLLTIFYGYFTLATLGLM